MENKNTTNILLYSISVDGECQNEANPVYMDLKMGHTDLGHTDLGYIDLRYTDLGQTDLRHSQLSLKRCPR